MLEPAQENVDQAIRLLAAAAGVSIPMRLIDDDAAVAANCEPRARTDALGMTNPAEWSTTRSRRSPQAMAGD
jgi:hypothetical protein